MVATQETIKKEKLQLISWSGDQVGGQVMDRFSIVMLFFQGRSSIVFSVMIYFFDRFFEFLDFFSSWILGLTIHIFPPLKCRFSNNPFEVPLAADWNFLFSSRKQIFYVKS